LRLLIARRRRVIAAVLQEAAVLGSDARANGMLDQTDLRWRDRS
jgi:hypothetical protein